jgi:hypothetical protein
MLASFGMTRLSLLQQISDSHSSHSEDMCRLLAVLVGHLVLIAEGLALGQGVGVLYATRKFVLRGDTAVRPSIRLYDVPP